MTPLLNVEHVTKTFHHGGLLFRRARAEIRAVDGVSFHLEDGETLGLVGETGSGKTTLGRLVMRLAEPSSGRILLGGKDVTEQKGRALRLLRRDVQMVFQDPFGSLDPRMSVGALVAEPMLVHGIPRQERRERTQDVLERVGLNRRHLGRYPHEFSGGQRQRIGIARALTVNPRLLVLDEPVSALDVSIQAQILNLLMRLQQDAGLAYLFIAHDLSVVRHVSDRVAVLYLGRIVETAPREQIYGSALHPYTLALLSAVPLADPGRERSRRRLPLHGEIASATNVPNGCRFHPRCFRARQGRGGAVHPKCTEQDPPLMEAAPGHYVACHFPCTANT